MGLLDGWAMVTDANFLSLVAHELRNPIAVIKGLALTLSQSRDRLSEDEISECLSRLLRQADRLGHLVDDLIVSSQSSGERLQLILESVELRDIVDRAVESVPRPTDKTVDVDVPPGMRVKADAFRLEQVFTNLLDNAYRYGVRVSGSKGFGTKTIVCWSPCRTMAMAFPRSWCPRCSTSSAGAPMRQTAGAWGWGSPLLERWWKPVGATFGTNL